LPCASIHWIWQTGAIGSPALARSRAWAKVSAAITITPAFVVVRTVEVRACFDRPPTLSDRCSALQHIPTSCQYICLVADVCLRPRRAPGAIDLGPWGTPQTRLPRRRYLPSQESSEINRYVSITPRQRANQPARQRTRRVCSASTQTEWAGAADPAPLSLWVVTRQCEDWSLLPGNRWAPRALARSPCALGRAERLSLFDEVPSQGTARLGRQRAQSIC
jgi:hypothetical protein